VRVITAPPYYPHWRVAAGYHAGRSSDNTFIKSILGWKPKTPLREGMKKTYAWIEQQYLDRKAGKKVLTEYL